MNINHLNKLLFNSLIHATHWLTETEGRYQLGKPVMRALGAITLGVKKGRHQQDVQAAAEEWQRMFPSRKMVPIVEVQGETVIAEIRSECPYRGSGNVQGCYRMMEYDRTMMEAIGADFVVLDSQSEPGREYCRVALTRELGSRPDLIPAHLKSIKRGSQPSALQG